jgi:succinoglycan biosynthesis protein ExoM
MEKIAICVCTCKRPKMLRECLDSLASQASPKNVIIEIVVIDNESRPNNKVAVEAFADKSQYPIHYVHEPERGISHARNAALDRSYSLGADWIAFIDDDEVACPDWVKNLHEKAYSLGTERWYRLLGPDAQPIRVKVPVDVILGPVRYKYPDDAARWRRRSQYGDWSKIEGADLPAAATNNVMFRTDLVIEKKLRFDITLSLMGSEDVFFFKKLKEGGATIKWSFFPMVIETVPWERITFRAHAKKSFRRGITIVESGRLFDRRFKRRKYIKKALRRGVIGLAKIIAAPVAIAYGHNGVMHAMMSGTRNLSESFGILAGLKGFKYEYYKKTTGF